LKLLKEGRVADFNQLQSQADAKPLMFPSADLQGAKISGVNLRGAQLRAANLDGVNLDQADLSSFLRLSDIVP
jgi:uncharacterized protein YjbI with pentapeptide repeats